MAKSTMSNPNLLEAMKKQEDTPCLCGQQYRIKTLCWWRKDEDGDPQVRCMRCMEGGDFYPWDDRDLKYVSRNDIDYTEYERLSAMYEEKM